MFWCISVLDKVVLPVQHSTFQFPNEHPTLSSVGQGLAAHNLQTALDILQVVFLRFSSKMQVFSKLNVSGLIHTQVSNKNMKKK